MCGSNSRERLDSQAQARREVADKQDTVVRVLGFEIAGARRNKKGARVVQAFDTLQDLVIRRQNGDDLGGVIDAYVDGFTY